MGNAVDILNKIFVSSGDKVALVCGIATISRQLLRRRSTPMRYFGWPDSAEIKSPGLMPGLLLYTLSN